MPYDRTPVFASQELRRVALAASKTLLSIAIKEKNGYASAIATQLHFVDTALQEQELYQISPGAQVLAAQALRYLLKIFQWPEDVDVEGSSLSAATPRELRESLLYLLEKSKERVTKSITRFCGEDLGTIEPFRAHFIQLYQALSIEDSQDVATITSNVQYRRPPERDIYPNEIHEVLLAGVREQSMCVQIVHKTPMLDRLANSHWHITQLCLDSGTRSTNHRIHFNIVAANSDMTYWQEMVIAISGKGERDSAGTSRLSPPNVPLDQHVKRGDFCKWLEKPCYDKIRLDLDEYLRFYEKRPTERLGHIISGSGVQLSDLLQNCDLTVEHKIKLSYAIARAFWKFYGSDILGPHWTSEDIIFIPLDEEQSPTGAVPLRPFVPLPFARQHKEQPEELDDKGRNTHAFPEILHLGIVLLEIGLGQALRLGYDSRLKTAAHPNKSHIKARMKLRDLKAMDWSGFHGKDYFTRAVENCLDSVNFKGSLKARKKPGQVVRDAIYDKIVAPLAWMAIEGFGDGEERPLVCVGKNKSLTADNMSKSREDIDFVSFQTELDKHTSFSTGDPSSKDFLEGLRVVAGYIEQRRRQVKVTKRIRVAILDTGCRTDMSFFQKPERLNRLKDWKDFSHTAAAERVDDFGHGTFMAKLLMLVAPTVDVYSVRIAKNTDELENSRECIAKAIEHAALHPDWNVDIISMSFALSETEEGHDLVAEAIEKVVKERNGSILFLASAGNSWDRGEDFPASHRDVIPIYAVDANRRHLESNPTLYGESSNKLYTHGTDIPPFVRKDIQDRFPSADLKSGTSIATAIAAGVAATTLSYVSALPKLLGSNDFEEACDKIFTKRGMEHMLHAMAPEIGYRQHFINPLRFWREKKRPMDVFMTICRIVEETKKEK